MIPSGNVTNGSGSTSGAVTTTIGSIDTTTAYNGLNNCMITVIVLVQGRTTGGAYIRMTLLRSFSRESGTIAALDASVITLGTTFASAALAAATGDIDFSSNTIRCRMTGVAGQDVNWVSSWSLLATEPS